MNGRTGAKRGLERLRGRLLRGAAWALVGGSMTVPLLANAQPPALRDTAAERRDLSAELGRVLLPPSQVAALAVAPPRRFAIHRGLGSGAVRVTTLAEAFGRKVLDAGSVAVVAPRYHREIVARPGPPRLYADMAPEARMQLLLALLSEEQWRLAGSVGLGVRDMTPDQQAIFLSGFPDPMQKVRHVWNAPPAQAPPSGGSDTIPVPEAEPQTIDPADLRLRLSKRTVFQFLSRARAEKGATSSLQFNGHAFDPALPPFHLPGSVTYTLEAATTPPVNANETEEELEPVEGEPMPEPPPYAFGVPLTRLVPTRAKPGDLDFAATGLDAPVTLDTPPETVRGWLERIEGACGLTLRADARVADLPVAVTAQTGATVRAGDLLSALALGLPGAFRRVGAADDPRPVYLLTDDRDGLGTRYARLQEWALRAQQGRDRLGAPNRTQTPPDMWSLLPPAPGDPLDGQPGLQTQVETAFRRANRPYAKDEVERNDEGAQVAVNTLPPSVQAGIREARTYLRSRPDAPDIVEDKVRLEVRLDVAYVLPDGSSVPHNQFNFEFGRFFFPQHEMTRQAALKRRQAKRSDPAPAVAVAPLALPASLRRRVLWVPPVAESELTDIAAKAARRGFTDLWLPVPETESGFDTAPLTAAIAMGRKHGLTVCAVASLLRGKRGEPEVNLLGEASSPTAPSLDDLIRRLNLPAALRNDPDFQNALLDTGRVGVGWRAMMPEQDRDTAKRLRRLASVALLGGLVLTDTRAPGYESSEGGMSVDVSSAWGYTPAQRKAFLLKEGIDPVDIAPRAYGLPILSLGRYKPFRMTPPVREERGMVSYARYYADTWNTFRAHLADERLTGLYATLRSEFPQLGLWLGADPPQSGNGQGQWWGSWDKASPRPGPIDRHAPSARAGAAHVVSRVALWYDRHPATAQPQTAEQFAVQLKSGLTRGGAGWDGVVIDVSEQTTTDVLRLLDGLRPAVSGK